ncbi:Hypp7013 [Branchiostoma lanceolatum]|uniref:Hypp7013 protein n=1 Tax=Branchiostoma lanceolatum TaxID=7740 RepID=A0A8J9YWJ1_BRALA|nr:Hypp7013 [Branchiostoma lanceolatum]
MEYSRKVWWLSLLLLSACDASQGDEKLVQGAEPVCEDIFTIHHNLIIRTKESLENKAVFLDSFMADQAVTCLETCCATDGCDTAVFSESGRADSSRNCYLFGCQGRCSFTGHSGYLIMIKRDPSELTPLPTEPDPSGQ